MKVRSGLSRRDFLIFAGATIGGLLLISNKAEPKKLLRSVSKNLFQNTQPTLQARLPTETPPPTEVPENIEVIVTGDVMLGRSVMTTSLDRADPAYPFRNVGEVLRGANIVFVNLETPIISGCPRTDTGMRFCAEPSMVEGLTYAGIDIVTLANNHTRDYLEEGQIETRNVLRESGIMVTGLGGLETIRVGETDFGFLGFNFISSNPTEEDFELVRRSSAQADVLMVGIHWGGEYRGVPSTLQQEWARRIVENGADVVVGHHPHWVQNTEYINGKPVYYSLGNFVFDQMWSEETRRGMAVRLTFQGSTLISSEELPIYMSSWAQPEFEIP